MRTEAFLPMAMTIIGAAVTFTARLTIFRHGTVEMLIVDTMLSALTCSMLGLATYEILKNMEVKV